MVPEDKTKDEEKFKREQDAMLAQECRNSNATFSSFGATPKSIPIVNLYAESMRDPGDNVTEQ